MLDNLPQQTCGGSTFSVHLDGNELDSLLAVAAGRGLSPCEWIRRLVRAHVTGEPQWDLEHLQTLADAASAIKQIQQLAKPAEAGGTSPLRAAVGDSVMSAFLARVERSAEYERRYWGHDRQQSA